MPKILSDKISESCQKRKDATYAQEMLGRTAASLRKMNDIILATPINGPNILLAMVVIYPTTKIAIVPMVVKGIRIGRRGGGLAVKTSWVFWSGYVANDIWLSIAATGTIKFVKTRKIMRGTKIVLADGRIFRLHKGGKSLLDDV